jgi:lysophospholipase L1-like esterase
MKDQTNIRIFFVILGLLFWNPLTYYGIFHDNPIFKSKILILIFALVFVALLAGIFLLKKQKLNNRLNNILFTFSITSFVYLIFVCLDSLFGAVMLKKPLTEAENKMHNGIIFEPNSSAHYKSIEFDYVAKINSIGLRDNEIGAKKDGTFRIVCIGDSWTFGWGVSNENSWPKQLEKILLAQGYKVEVINCGQGGQYTETYKKYLRKAVPVLKPDLVLIGLLQLDDLAQLYENRAKITECKNIQPAVSGIRYVTLEFFKESFKNLLKWLNQRNNKPFEVNLNWKERANAMLSKFTPLQKISYSTYDDTLRRLFENGDLNPALMEYLVELPDRGTIFNDTASGVVKFAKKELQKDLMEMKLFCDSNKIPMHVLNMPTATFAGHKIIRKTGEKQMNEYLASHNEIDPLYRNVCGQLNIPYFEMTTQFADLKEKDKYFFLYDGHPNPKGYGEIAYLIADYLKKTTLKK